MSAIRRPLSDFRSQLKKNRWFRSMEVAARSVDAQMFIEHPKDADTPQLLVCGAEFAYRFPYPALRKDLDGLFAQVTDYLDSIASARRSAPAARIEALLEDFCRDQPHLQSRSRKEQVSALLEAVHDYACAQDIDFEDVLPSGWADTIKAVP